MYITWEYNAVLVDPVEPHKPVSKVHAVRVPDALATARCGVNAYNGQGKRSWRNVCGPIDVSQFCKTCIKSMNEYHTIQ